MKKKAVILISILFVFFDCSSDGLGKNSLIGKWKLIEVLADPGDGSGVFKPVDSNKTLEFFEDGFVRSNGSLCTFNIIADQESQGIYNTEDSSIIPDNCNSNFIELKINFKIEGSRLILNYFCIEACSEKYKRIN
jgi:hypothetical protein